MTSSLILAGLGLAAIGFTGRALMRNRHIVTKAVGSLPLNELFSKYVRNFRLTIVYLLSYWSIFEYIHNY